MNDNMDYFKKRSSTWQNLSRVVFDFKKASIVVLLIALVILSGCENKNNKKETPGEETTSSVQNKEKRLDGVEFLDKIDGLFKDQVGSLNEKEIKELYQIKDSNIFDMRCYILEDDKAYTELFVSYSTKEEERDKVLNRLPVRANEVRNNVQDDELKNKLDKVENVVIKSGDDYVLFIISDNAKEYAKKVEDIRLEATK